MRLTVTLTVALEHDDDPAPERHDTTLDAMVERPGTERDPAAEMDGRGRYGFQAGGTT